jgi:hypothetical protein
MTCVLGVRFEGSFWFFSVVRVMYEVDKLDRVVELNDAPPSSAGAPLPLVLSDEHNVLLGYLISVPDPNWDGTYVRSLGPLTPDQSVAIVRFESPYAHLFGPPNDEALGGHPLASRGLRWYGVFEVMESSWIRRLERMNSVHPRHKRAWFLEDKRHFIFTFHDSTFECIAKSYTIERVGGTLASALDRMRELLTENWHQG